MSSLVALCGLLLKLIFYWDNNWIKFDYTTRNRIKSPLRNNPESSARNSASCCSIYVGSRDGNDRFSKMIFLNLLRSQPEILGNSILNCGMYVVLNRFYLTCGIALGPRTQYVNYCSGTPGLQLVSRGRYEFCSKGSVLIKFLEICDTSNFPTTPYIFYYSEKHYSLLESSQQSRAGGRLVRLSIHSILEQQRQCRVNHDQMSFCTGPTIGILTTRHEPRKWQ